MTSCSQSWQSFMVQTSSASNEERRVFPVHDLLCFTVDGVQDYPTWAPGSQLDMLVLCYVDICRLEDQVSSLSSVWWEASAGDPECRLKSDQTFVFAKQGEQQLVWQIEVGSSNRQKFQPADYYNIQACWWWMHAQVMCMQWRKLIDERNKAGTTGSNTSCMFVEHRFSGTDHSQRLPTEVWNFTLLLPSWMDQSRSSEAVDACQARWTGILFPSVCTGSQFSLKFNLKLLLWLNKAHAHNQPSYLISLLTPYIPLHVLR